MRIGKQSDWCLLWHGHLCLPANQPPQRIGKPYERHGHEGEQQDIEERIEHIRIIFPPLHAIGIYFLDKER